MPEQPLVSIIVPAYNVARYVREAVDSALSQTYPRVEVVVVDDGSTDDTVARLDDVAAHLTVIRQENRGLAGARNTGVRHARGDLIGLLDADDVWAPARVERCVEHLLAHPAHGLVTTDAWLIDDDTPSERRYYGDWFQGSFPDAGQLAAIAVENFVFVGALVRRSLLAQAGPFDESLRRAEDYDMWIRLLLAGTTVGFVNEPLAGYRLRGDSLSADTTAQRAAHLTVLRKHLHALWRSGARGRPGDAYDVAKLAEAQGNRREAAGWYWLGVRDARLAPIARAKLVGAGARSLVRRGTPR